MYITSAIQVNNRRKTISIEEKLDVISRLDKGEGLLTYAVMLDSLITECVQYAIMLPELQKVLSRYLQLFV